MYLKTLSLRGFKSFADPTTLELEPGVTVVVGPNGSGKSNVVDALAWVLGAQGPRVVRSQKMDDVIFAGTDARPPLGRAEVSVTIDNSARRLPIDFTEVTITRTLFRTGESEYAINATPCRLLDVQELLADSGVGRQQHVIVSQGQLDTILSARPEDRRMVIEEAAGVLKFRRRRERAQRRLESAEASLSRLGDLLTEVKRQLRPLERQAHAARRHADLANELRALRLHLAGAELAELASRQHSLERRAEGLEAEISAKAALEGRLSAALADAQQDLSVTDPQALGPVRARLDQLGERLRGLDALLLERRRAENERRALLEDVPGADDAPDELARVEADLERALGAASELRPEWEELEALEAALESDRTDQRAAVGSPSDLKDERQRLEQQERAARDRLEAARSETVRATERLSSAQTRELSALERAAELEQQHGELRRLFDEALALAGSADKDEHEAERRAEAAEAAWRRAVDDHQERRAQARALELALETAREATGARALSFLSGSLGRLLDQLDIDEGYALSVEAALAGAGEATVVENARVGRAALEELRREGIGGSVLVGDVPPVPGSPKGGDELLVNHVRARTEEARRLVSFLLGDVVVARDLEDALERTLRYPHESVASMDGVVLSPRGWRIASVSKGATRAGLELAEAKEAQARQAAEEAATAEAAARQALEAARHETRELHRAVEQARAGEQSVDRELARARQDAASASSAVTAAAAVLEQARHALDDAATASDELGEKRRSFSSTEEARTKELAAAEAARQQLEERGRAVEALRRDLEVRAASLEERRSILSSRALELRALISRRAAAVERSGMLRVDGFAFERALEATEDLLSKARRRLHLARTELDEETARREEAASLALGRIASLREEREGLEAFLAQAREERQRLEIARAEASVRNEAAIERLYHELDAVPAEAAVAPAPELPPGRSASEQLTALEAELRRLGPVNPLAEEELTALSERHGFLESQLADVTAARRELNQVIRAIDAEIVDVFLAAYNEVEQHFSALVSDLFPGGSGRLSLTAPDDLLETGVEIEARPAGRAVRRLSLLSGGERSLVALAFLFAVFRARPSPFYVLDEVEAALDEVNLGRFIELLGEFRSEAQLLVVSHQKKTMEVADILFGVTMQPGGASKVVSEPLRRRRDEVGARPT